MNKSMENVVVKIGMYLQHFKRELCNSRQFSEATYVFKVIGTQVDDTSGRLMVRLEKRFGNFHDIWIPADEVFSEVDHKKYPHIRQKYIFEEITSNSPMYPLHPEDSKYLPIERYEKGKYDVGDTVTIPIINSNDYDKLGMHFTIVIDNSTKTDMGYEFQRKVDRGVAFIMIPPDWDKLRESGELIVSRVVKENRINVSDIIGHVIEFDNDNITVRILHPGPFNRLLKDNIPLSVHRRVASGSGIVTSDFMNSLELICFDLDIPSEYIVEL